MTGSSEETLTGYASAGGTRKYADYAVRQKGKPPEHFRLFDGLYLSSVGMGTYLGEPTAEDDKSLENAVYESVKSGAINVIDTAINYRAMKSEKSIGRALSQLVRDGIISRDQIFISTKHGYITNDGDYPTIDVMEYVQRMYISTGLIKADDISSGYNVLNPTYIEKSIDKSLCNMHISTIDLEYIHNAYESWYQDVTKEEFLEMLAKVFQVYENYRSANKLRYYGMATWTCFRVPPESNEYLSLASIVRIAENAVRAGDEESHGFRFIQLPYNLAYSEALFLKNQTVGSEKNLSLLEAASRLNVGVFTSIPLFQGRLLRPNNIPNYIGGTTNPVVKLIQIIRSSPSVIAPLIGQKKPEHVRQNLEISDIPPMTEQEFKKAVEFLSK